MINEGYIIDDVKDSDKIIKIKIRDPHWETRRIKLFKENFVYDHLPENDPLKEGDIIRITYNGNKILSDKIVIENNKEKKVHGNIQRVTRSGSSFIIYDAINKTI